MSWKYRVPINYRKILQNHIFTNTEQKYIMLLPFERGMFAVSYSDVQIVVWTRVEPPQNCYFAQIPGHTNYALSVRQPFHSNTGLRFSREMAVATIPNVTFAVCDRHEFHDLATLPTQVVV
jgi:hypothetical protein